MEPTKPSDGAAPTESPLMAALQQQLRAIIDKQLTPRTLLELEQTARLSRELLVVGKMPDARGARPSGMLYGGGMFNTGLISPDGLTGSYETAPYVSSAPSETFGASMVRELVAVLPALMPKKEVHRESAASLIDAITAAREAKMDDVVNKLKAKLDALLEETGPDEPVVNTALKGGGVPQIGGPGGFACIESQPIGVGTIKVPTASNGARATTTDEEVTHVVLP